MPDTTCHMSISLDGFVAGPDQSREDPLGKRGRELHGWHIGDPRANDADKVANEWLMRPRGAYVMGRNMFGPIRGDWDEEWTGLVGPRTAVSRAGVRADPSRAMTRSRWTGGTTFHFVTEGFDAAYSAACEAAGDNGRGHRRWGLDRPAGTDRRRDRRAHPRHRAGPARFGRAHLRRGRVLRLRTRRGASLTADHPHPLSPRQLTPQPLPAPCAAGRSFTRPGMVGGEAEAVGEPAQRCGSGPPGLRLSPGHAHH